MAFPWPLNGGCLLSGGTYPVNNHGPLRMFAQAVSSKGDLKIPPNEGHLRIRVQTRSVRKTSKKDS